MTIPTHILSSTSASTRVVAALLAAALLAFVAAAPVRADSPALNAGVVIETGYAFALDPATGDWNPVQPIDALSAGAQIGTGPDTRLLLTFPDGSVMQIEPDTHLSLVTITADNVVVYQFHGNTWARAAGTAETTLIIETPSGFLIVTDADLKATVHADGGLEVKITGGQADLGANGDPYGTPMSTGDLVRTGDGNQPTVDVLALEEVEVLSLAGLREQVPPPVVSLEITVETVVIKVEEVAGAVAAMTESEAPEPVVEVVEAAPAVATRDESPVVVTSTEPTPVPTPEPTPAPTPEPTPAPVLTEAEARAIMDAAIDTAKDIRDTAKDDAKDIKDAAIDSAKDIRDTAIDAAKETRDAATDAAKDVRDATIDAAKATKDAETEAAQDIEDKDDRKAAKNAAKDKFKAAKGAAKDIFEAAEDAAKEAFKAAEDAAKDIFKVAEDAAKDAYDAAKDLADDIFKAAKDAARAAFEELFPE